MEKELEIYLKSISYETAPVGLWRSLDNTRLKTIFPDGTIYILKSFI